MQLKIKIHEEVKVNVIKYTYNKYKSLLTFIINVLIIISI